MIDLYWFQRMMGQNAAYFTVLCHRPQFIDFEKTLTRPLQAIPQQVIIVGYVHALSSYIGLDTKIGWHANN